MPLRAIAALAAALSLLSAWGCARPAASPSPAPTAEATPTQQRVTRPDGPASPTPPISIPIITTDGTSITTLEVERNGVDLPTFLHAAATELARDPRIVIVSERIDGELLPDGAPVAVVTFEVAGAETAGSQYTLAHENGSHFIVTTCLAGTQSVSLCDEAYQALDGAY